MTFVPAGEVIGEMHRVRTVRIAKHPQLPDGEYSFVDMYCTDPKCDCRKTMISVVHAGRCVSIINYGWESPRFYRRWMGDGAEEFASPMAGASIDSTSPNLVSAQGMLGLFRSLLSDDWKRVFERHYALVKARLAGRTL